MANDEEEKALFDDLAGGTPARQPADEGSSARLAMLQVIKGDSTLRHVKELIFEYNQMLIELGCDVGSFQVLACPPVREMESRCLHVRQAALGRPPFELVACRLACRCLHNRQAAHGRPPFERPWHAFIPALIAKPREWRMLQDLDTELRELPGRYSPENMGCIYVVYPVSSQSHPTTTAIGASVDIDVLPMAGFVRLCHAGT